MNMATKHAVLQAHLKEWLACKGEKNKRGTLAKRLSQSLHLHIKSIPRSMKRLQTKCKSDKEKRGRPKKYGADVNAALAQVWEAMEYPCAENMPCGSIDEYVSYFTKEKRWGFNNETTDNLLVMSEGTKKILISAMRQKRGILRGRSATVSSPLKGMIPIRKSHTWVDLPPGYLQTDSVVHCGDLLTGDVIYSVGCVDFATYWSEYTTQWNKGDTATKESLETLRERFPFTWNELHPDTGNEFINYHVHRWATEEGIAMTRSEPYKKNDNMCIEERNNSIARKHLGYARMDDSSLVPLASEILKTACILSNHFRPVRRMTDKVRIGAKWKRTFEKKSMTPYQRVLERKDISDDIKKALREEHETLNPLELKRKLDILKSELGQKLEDLKKKKSEVR
jgi:hypothetical protein